jgi:hypothetical protein
MKKTVAACQMNIENLWQPGFRVYMWTFTFNVVHSDWDAMRLWSKFLSHVRLIIGAEWSGVRVVEVHPGGHGLHFHMLVNRRLSIWLMRKAGICNGFGRMDVRVADQNKQKVAQYMSKYLSKGRDKVLTKSGRSARMWACLGPARRVLVKNLENMSPCWQFRRAKGFPFLDYAKEHWLRWAWHYGPEVFTKAWFAAKNGQLGDLIGLSQGVLRVEDGHLVQRMTTQNLADCLSYPF